MINWYSCCLLFGIDIAILAFTFIVLRVDTLRERESVAPSALLNCASISLRNTLVVVVVMMMVILLNQCCAV